MLHRIHNVRPLSMPRTHDPLRCHVEQFLVLIGDGSDEDDVLRYFRDMWPEVEIADRAEPPTPIEHERNLPEKSC